MVAWSRWNRAPTLWTQSSAWRLHDLLAQPPLEITPGQRRNRIKRLGLNPHGAVELLRDEETTFRLGLGHSGTVFLGLLRAKGREDAALYSLPMGLFGISYQLGEHFHLG